MIAISYSEADEDLERAFDYYDVQRPALGHELLDEYRRGLELILTHPNLWQPLDLPYRRYRLKRFPYGIVYRVDTKRDQIVIVEFMHLSQKPGSWRKRDRAPAP